MIVAASQGSIFMVVASSMRLRRCSFRIFSSWRLCSVSTVKLIQAARARRWRFENDDCTSSVAFRSFCLLKNTAVASIVCLLEPCSKIEPQFGTIFPLYIDPKTVSCIRVALARDGSEAAMFASSLSTCTRECGLMQVSYRAGAVCSVALRSHS